MKALEERFHKPHPELEGFKEPLPAFGWLIRAFFRLHRRRQFTDMGGMVPLSYAEMTVYAGKVERIDRSLEPLFYRCMEAADNAVLYDHSERLTKHREAEKKAADEAPRKGKRPPPKRR